MRAAHPQASNQVVTQQEGSDGLKISNDHIVLKTVS